MIDRRENILARLLVILGQVPGIASVYRNRGEIGDADTPAAVLLDGDEHVSILINNVTPMPATMVTLAPQVVIILPMYDDVSNTTINGAGQPLGPYMSSIRMSVMNAILNDETLVMLLGGYSGQGKIRYVRTETSMKIGSEIGVLGANMMMEFAITYSLDPSELS